MIAMNHARLCLYLRVCKLVRYNFYCYFEFLVVIRKQHTEHPATIAIKKNEIMSQLNRQVKRRRFHTLNCQ